VNFGTVTISEADRSFWKEVVGFLDEHAEAIAEQEWRTGDGVNPDVYKAMGDKGWLMPWLPPEEGGIAATPIQLAILARELRAHRVPQNAYSNTMQVIAMVNHFGTAALREEVALPVAQGDVRICLGYTEPDCGSDLANVKTRAVRDGDEWVVTGQKMFTTTAQHAHYAFVLARTDPEAAKHRGLTTFLVPLTRGGIEIRAIHTLGGERSNMVFFDEVRITDHYRVGAVNDAWSVMNSALDIEHGLGESSSAGFDVDGGLNFTGTLALTLDAAVRWAGQPQPDGTRPLDDLHVRQTLAMIAAEVELTRLPAGPPGRVLSSESLIANTAIILELIGPDVLLQRGEDGAVADGWPEYAHRFAQGTAIYGGTTDVHRSIVAEKYLGMPRSRAR
jgi:alkylation response protein AidB-like acyl-CoA dehydrogenase